eukprot:606217-Hanusia_phi.AAC.1
MLGDLMSLCTHPICDTNQSPLLSSPLSSASSLHLCHVGESACDSLSDVSETGKRKRLKEASLKILHKTSSSSSSSSAATSGEARRGEARRGEARRGEERRRGEGSILTDP